MQGTFIDIIKNSLEWTSAVLFRPFKFKKWIFLCIIALFAAEFSGCSINFNLPSHQKPLPVSIPKIPWLIPVVIFAVTAGLIFAFFLIWLYSRFSFIFLNSIATNDASIKIPFRENRKAGNSFFKWNIFFLFITVFLLLILASVFIAGISFLKDFSAILMVILWIFSLFALTAILVLVHIILHDLVLPVMFKDRINIIKAWKVSLRILEKEKFNFFKYLAVKLGLRIIAFIISGLFTMAVIFALVIQILVLGGLLYSISLALPEGIRWGYYILLIIIGIIFFISILLGINIILLPIPVFFRTYSLKFLARIDERYDLFKLKD